ncbi:CDP-glycerol glycerophosphotransferase family protein, partial [Escherichia coli]|nr:CDP-glycerol glycerophosphotransferase family protein [Escherichia coli]
MKKIKFIVKFILGRIVYFLSGFFPRNPNIWVFGSFNGFEDNPKYLYLHVLNKNKEIRSIWIAKDKMELLQARNSGGEAYLFNSIKGFLFTLNAGIYIYSAYITDISFIASRKAKKVNLWHGIPIKKIEFDITSKPLVNHFSKANFINKMIYAYKHIVPDLLLCPSKYSAEYSFKSAFRISERQCLFARYPRVSALLEMKMNKENKKIILYMPTWRDKKPRFLDTAKIEFEKLNTIMRTYDALFVIKLHPLTIIDRAFEYSNISICNKDSDLNELLFVSDCLVTDYSSVVFDYLHLNKPIIFYNFDMDDYLKGREFYFDYNSIICGEIASDYSSLESKILAVIKGVDLFERKRKEIYDKFTSETGGNQLIVSSIKK